MAGLLDFIGTPEGQGLLSAAFGGLAGARRGAPLNSIGIAGLSGLQGYQNAQQQGVMNQYRDLQSKKIEADLAQKQAAQDFFRGGSASQLGQVPTGVFQQSASGAPATGSAPTAPQPTGPTMSPEMLRRMLMSGNPYLVDMAKNVTGGLRDLAPVTSAAGSFTIDPVTNERRYLPKVAEGMTLDDRGNAVNLPGYVDANVQAKGAEAAAIERAKYPYVVGADRAKQQTAAGLDLVQVPMPDGSVQMMPRAAAAAMTGGNQGFGRSQSPVVQSATQEINDNFITNSYQPTIDAGAQAGSMIANLDALKNVDFRTGWGAEAKAGAANVLTGLGVAPELVEKYAGDAQKFQSVTMDNLLTKLMAQKGPQTEGDSIRAQQTFAKVANTPEANAFIMDFARAKANMDQRKARFYEAALPIAQKTGDLQRIDREWRKHQGSIWADPALSRWKK